MSPDGMLHAPAKLTHEQLLGVLEDVCGGFKQGDTLEGFVEFVVSDDAEHWEVRARYRVGNVDGQGSVRMVGDFVERRNPPQDDVC